MSNMVSQLSVHQEHEVLLKLEAAGLNGILAQKFIESKGNGIAKAMIRLIEHGGIATTTSQMMAAKIMGKNFFGPADAVGHFGLNPTQGQLAMLATVPFTEKELREKKDTHILVAIFPLSILEIREKVVAKGNVFYGQSWYNRSQAFAENKGEVGWKLVRKTEVPNSISKTYTEQEALLSDKDEVSTAQVVVYTMVGHYLKSGERLFERIYVRTSDLASDGRRVDVGDFDGGGLVVFGWLDGGRRSSLGLASARKSN